MRNQRGGGRTRQSTKAASACQQVAEGRGLLSFFSLSLYFLRSSIIKPGAVVQTTAIGDTGITDKRVCATALAQSFFKGQLLSSLGSNESPRLHPRGRSGLGVWDVEGWRRRLEAAGEIYRCGERGDEVLEPVSEKRMQRRQTTTHNTAYKSNKKALVLFCGNWLSCLYPPLSEVKIKQLSCRRLQTEG